MLNEIIGKKKYEELKNVLIELNDIPYAIVKGEALSLQGYGKCGMRKSGDIDILVPKRYLALVNKILNQYGFFTGDENTIFQRRNELLFLSTSHQLKPYKKITTWGEVEIDINFDIYWGYFLDERIDMNDFLSKPNIVNIYGNYVKVLDPIKSMIQLILHHYREMNSIYHLINFNSIKTSMFLDIYCLLKNNVDDISVNSLCLICRKMNIVPYAFYIFYYTKKCFNDDILNTYIEHLSTPDGIRLLSKYGLKDDEKKEWKIDFKIRLDSNNLSQYLIPELSFNDINRLKINNEICEVR